MAVSKEILLLSSSRLTNADNIELKPSFEKLALNLVRDAVKPNMAFGDNRVRLG